MAAVAGIRCTPRLTHIHPGMKIGELASATGTPVETIRYYEKQGLLPAPGRSGGNYRLYGTPQVERLQFIRHCRGLDMSLDEVRALLAFKDDPAADCGAVDRLLDQHIGHVSRRIRELRALEQQLKELRGRCATRQDAARCGILSGLSGLSAGLAAGGSPGHLRTVHDKPVPRQRRPAR